MIYTSYFANIKKLPNYLKIVSISRFPPKWFEGEINKELAPLEESLLAIKKGELSKEEFKEKYLKQLEKLDSKKLKKELKNKVLCCYEKPEEFCHRHILKEWFEKNEIKCIEKLTFNIAIIGSRSFDDKIYLEYQMNQIKNEYKNHKLKIVSGAARGADKMGEEWAKRNKIETLIFPANWEKYGKRAGYIRNEDIISNADLVISFWDGKSSGTKHSQELAKKNGKDLRIFMYPKEKNKIELIEKITKKEVENNKNKTYLLMGNEKEEYSKQEKELQKYNNVYFLKLKKDKKTTKNSYFTKEELEELEKEKYLKNIFKNIKSKKIVIEKEGIDKELVIKSKETYKILEKEINNVFQNTKKEEEEIKEKNYLEF